MLTFLPLKWSQIDFKVITVPAQRSSFCTRQGSYFGAVWPILCPVLYCRISQRGRRNPSRRELKQKKRWKKYGDRISRNWTSFDSCWKRHGLQRTKRQQSRWEVTRASPTSVWKACRNLQVGNSHENAQVVEEWKHYLLDFRGELQHRVYFVFLRVSLLVFVGPASDLGIYTDVSLRKCMVWVGREAAGSQWFSDSNHRPLMCLQSSGAALMGAGMQHRIQTALKRVKLRKGEAPNWVHSRGKEYRSAAEWKTA